MKTYRLKPEITENQLEQIYLILDEVESETFKLLEPLRFADIGDLGKTTSCAEFDTVYLPLEWVEEVSR